MPRLMFLKIKYDTILIPQFYMYILNNDIKNNKIKISWIEDDIKRTYILILNYYNKNKYYYKLKDIDIIDFKYKEEKACNSDYIEYENRIKKIKMKYYVLKNIFLKNDICEINNINIIDSTLIVE